MSMYRGYFSRCVGVGTLFEGMDALHTGARSRGVASHLLWHCVCVLTLAAPCL